MPDLERPRCSAMACGGPNGAFEPYSESPRIGMPRARLPGPGADGSGRSRARAGARGPRRAASRPPPGARASSPAGHRASRARRDTPGPSGRSSSASRTRSRRQGRSASPGRPRTSAARWRGGLRGRENRRAPSIPSGPAGLRTGPTGGGRPWVSWPRSRPRRSGDPACGRFPGRPRTVGRGRGGDGPPVRAWIRRAEPMSPA